MVELIVGDREKRKEYIEALRKQEGIPKEDTVFFIGEDFSERAFWELVPLQSDFFGERKLFVIEDAVKKLPIGRILEYSSAGSTPIIFSEEKILKADEKLFKEYNIPIHVFPMTKKEKKNSASFALADAFGERNRKKLWLAYRAAIERGEAVESIHGILFWGVKNLALVKRGEENALSPFVAKKTKRFAQNFSTEELLRYNRELRSLIHQREKGDLSELIEHWILSLPFST